MSQPDGVVLQISLTAEEHQKIEAQAHERGYDALGDYVRALIESDAHAHSESPDEDDDEIDPVESFERGWQQAMNGQTHPISTLWDDMDDN